MTNQFALLFSKKFSPLFITMFLGAFNDNLFKAVFAVMVAYNVSGITGLSAEIVVSIGAGIFILPFVLMAPLGGDLFDKFDKAKVMRLLKLAELSIVFLAALSLVLSSVWLMFFVLFMLGAQSALFAPGKYSYLPVHLNSQQLIGANGLLNSGSFCAILLGNIIGSLLGMDSKGHFITIAILALCAVIGLMSARYIPKTPSEDKNIPIRKNMLAGIWGNFHLTLQEHKSVILAMFGIAWFYFVGATFLAQFPNFTKQVLNVDNIGLSIFMSLFTIGIGIGGLLNNRLLKSQISMKYVSLSMLGVCIFSADFYSASVSFAQSNAKEIQDALNISLMSFSEFLETSFQAWRIVFDLIMVSVCGGLFVVPLNALMQERTKHRTRSRIIAASSVLDAFFVLISALLAVVMFSFGFSVVDLFLVVSVCSGLVAWFIGAKKTILEEAKS